VRIVLDTNVLVSGLLSSKGAPARVLTLALAGELTLLFDERVLEEYREVLSRPHFQIAKAEADEVLRQVETDGERVVAAAIDATLPDPDDLPFIEVAIAGRADALITGNTRHFPARLGVVVLSPRALLDRLDSK
jgi:putative PIN family toxin of toxin-antitoxin system